ncbi:MAG: OmpA family protein [Gammaproteobacteria bacterium]|nr:OmpA family protein [Gammaproteobacteria bacterium]
MKHHLLPIALIVTFAAGCTTTNPYTGEQQTSKAATGAGIGAVAGAVLGAVTGDNSDERKERALKGALIGGAAGGGAGYYMDVQEAKLREQLQGTGVSVTRIGDDIILNMPGNITFTTGSSAVRADFYPVLDSVVLVINKYKKTAVNVIGHTDSVGSDASNQQLSEQRAWAVSSYFSSRGVEPTRLRAYGYGETSPIADNSTESGRAANRRVQITLSPMGV